MTDPDRSAPLVVLGSANMDLVYHVATIPRPGQTLLASGQARHAGGKGLNQAVAGARAGADTAFVCALGDDADGRTLREVMDDVGIDTRYVRTVDAPTGTALITVQDDGDNAIVVAAGANGTLTELDPDQRDAVTGARVLVAQQEVPRQVLVEAGELTRSSGTRFVLNAAPATGPDRELLALVDVLVVNETEALAMSSAGESQSPAEGSPSSAEESPSSAERSPSSAEGSALAAAARLADQVGVVIVTLGADGCAIVRSGDEPDRIPALKADVVDTTGAGDTFTGVLAAGLAVGLELGAAARRAVVAAALSVERHGAVPSIPTRAEIDERAES